MIRVLITEDHNIVRNGITTLLNQEVDIEVVGQAHNGLEALELLNQGLAVDVVLTDINMPGMNGMELTQKIKASFPDINVLILSMLDQEDYIIRSIQSGASAYILKNISPEELTFAIRHVHLRSERYLCSELAFKLLDKVSKTKEHAFIPATDIDLTRREVEILNLISEGYTNQEIADKLYTSKRTVEGHRQSLLDKTGSKNSAALVRFAVLNGLIH